MRSSLPALSGHAFFRLSSCQATLIGGIFFRFTSAGVRGIWRGNESAKFSSGTKRGSLPSDCWVTLRILATCFRSAVMFPASVQRLMSERLSGSKESATIHSSQQCWTKALWTLVRSDFSCVAMAFANSLRNSSYLRRKLGDPVTVVVSPKTLCNPSSLMVSDVVYGLVDQSSYFVKC